MKRKFLAYILALLFLMAIPAGVIEASEAEKPTPSPRPSDILVISGTVANVQGKPVKEVGLTFFANGKKVEMEEETTTAPNGIYKVELKLPAGTLAQTRVELEAEKPSYKKSERVTLANPVQEKIDAKGNRYYLAHQSLALARAVSPAFWIATLILLGVYVLIAFEIMHRTLAALLGAALMMTITYTAGHFNPEYTILNFESAMKAVDMNVILLLMAMMIIVGVTKKTGVFQWIAYKSYQLARGNVYAIAGIMMFITAFVSAFLDNVTTMMLIIPVTIEIAITLKINPITLLLPEAFASNVGGTATLIGDPPNIMIGSYAKLTFMDFVRHLTVINLICLIVIIVYFIYWYKKDYLKAQVGDVQKMINHLREEYKITNKKLLYLLWSDAGSDHLSLHHPRGPAHGARRRCPDRGRPADGHQPGGHRRDAGKGDRVAHPDLFHDAVRGGGRRRGNGTDPDHCRLGQERFRRLPGGGDPDDPLGLGPGLGHHRQHSLHGHHAAHCGLPDHGHPRGPERGPLVGLVPGGLSGRQRDHDRGQRQRGHRGHGRAGRLSHLLHVLFEGGFYPHDHYYYPLFVLAVAGGDVIK